MTDATDVVVAAADAPQSAGALLLLLNSDNYQTLRARKIERNNAKLKSLGLITESAERASNAAAWGKPLVAAAPSAGISNKKKKRITTTAAHEKDGDSDYFCEGHDDDDDDDETSPNSRSNKRARKEANTSAASLLPRRTSSRLKGIEPDRATSIIATTPRELPMSPEDSDGDRVITVQEEQQLEQALQRRVAHTKNPTTATYEHCLMRVRTMSVPQLRNRIRTVERAAGQHCVIKMAIMARCLRDEGQGELAELAVASLARLQALRPCQLPSEI